MSGALYKPVRDWSLDDVRRLVDERIDEGQRLEYKRELNLRSRGERAEAAKDASGMANATGGFLIYGVEEEELPDGRRVPIRVQPISAGDAQSRLEDVLAAAVSPRLNYAATTIEADGGYVVVVQLEQRGGPLHMVEGYGENRYFIRTGLATRPMQAHEVEGSFRELRDGDDRLEQLLQRLPLIARLDPGRSRTGDLERSAHRGSRVEPMAEPWIAVITAALNAAGPLLSMRPIAASTDFNILEAEGVGRFVGRWEEVLSRTSLGIDAHGYLRDFEDDPGITQHLRLFREGVFEWGARWVNRGSTHYIPSSLLATTVHDVLAYFAWVYESVRYHGRVRLWIRIENADQSELALQRDMTLTHLPEIPKVEAISFTLDTNLDQLLGDPMPLVHDAMDYIWQGYGMSRCLLFSESGELRA